MGFTWHKNKWRLPVSKLSDAAFPYDGELANAQDAVEQAILEKCSFAPYTWRYYTVDLNTRQKQQLDMPKPVLGVNRSTE